MGNYAADLPSGKSSTKFPARVLNCGILHGWFIGYFVYEAFTSWVCGGGPPFHSRLPPAFPKVPGAMTKLEFLLYNARIGRGMAANPGTAAHRDGMQMLWTDEEDVIEHVPMRKAPGSILEVCAHWSHGVRGTNALHEPTLDYSSIAHDSLGALNIRELSTFNALDPDLALPVLPRHPRFTMRDLGPVLLDTFTNYMAYGLGFLWRRGARGE